MGLPSSRRRRARRDLTQNAIAQAITGLGGRVTDLSAVGGGVPDLLVSFRGRWLLVEAKSGKKVSHRTKKHELTPAQVAWHGQQLAPIAIVETPDEAITWLLGQVTGRLRSD